MTAHVQVGLARKTVTTWGMTVFGAAASAPMVVLVGGIVATYAATQLVSVPLLFLVVGAVVALLAVGYTAMSELAPHAAAYYSILARGLGRSIGVAGGAVALLAYNSIQISLYGLLGYTMAGIAGGKWWVWAGVALLLVAVFGVRAVTLTTGVLATVLIFSLLVVLVFTASSAVDPAAGAVSWQGYDPGGLFVPGIGGALALTVAAFMGFEVPGSLGEEAREKGAVTRSVFLGALVLSVAYSIVAWAMGVAVGPEKVAAAVTADPNLPFSIMQDRVGGFMTPVAQAALIFAIVTSLLAFHSVIARYTLAIAREGVAPAALAPSAAGVRVSAPIGGSVLQSVIAAVTVAAFALLGADPFATLFTWLSTLGAMGLLTLLIASSLAAIVYFRRSPQSAGMWASLVAPLLGIGFGSVILAAMVLNVRSLLLAAPGSPFPLLLPLIVVLTGVVGVVWAQRLRRLRPDVYDGIGEGVPDVMDVPDDVQIRF